VKNGKAIYEGDIVLEHVDAIESNSGGNTVTIAYGQYLWPKVGGVFQVPYVIDPASGDVTNINAAISQFNSTFPGLLQWVGHTTEANYVDINLDPNNFSGVCEAIVGDAGIGEQVVGGSASCSVATILHEMGHTVGLWHEQSRSDRNSYVTVNYNNLIKGSRSNFDQVVDNAQNVTLYDYASIMHYIPFAFSRNGGPAIESIPAGIPLSNYVGYTAADIDGIKRLYGAAPTMVTVTSNPPGLQVIVDGVTVTTPQTFSWALNSGHTLGHSSNVQTLAGNIVDSSTPTAFY
jgi:astacin